MKQTFVKDYMKVSTCNCMYKISQTLSQDTLRTTIGEEKYVTQKSSTGKEPTRIRVQKVTRHMEMPYNCKQMYRKIPSFYVRNRTASWGAGCNYKRTDIFKGLFFFPYRGMSVSRAATQLSYKCLAECFVSLNLLGRDILTHYDPCKLTTGRISLAAVYRR